MLCPPDPTQYAPPGVRTIVCFALLTSTAGQLLIIWISPGLPNCRVRASSPSPGQTPEVMFQAPASVPPGSAPAMADPDPDRRTGLQPDDLGMFRIAL